MSKIDPFADLQYLTRREMKDFLKINYNKIKELEDSGDLKPTELCGGRKKVYMLSYLCELFGAEYDPTKDKDEVLNELEFVNLGKVKETLKVNYRRIKELEASGDLKPIVLFGGKKRVYLVSYIRELFGAEPLAWKTETNQKYKRQKSERERQSTQKNIEENLQDLKAFAQRHHMELDSVLELLNDESQKSIINIFCSQETLFDFLKNKITHKAETEVVEIGGKMIRKYQTEFSDDEMDGPFFKKGRFGDDFGIYSKEYMEAKTKEYRERQGEKTRK